MIRISLPLALLLILPGLSLKGECSVFSRETDRHNGYWVFFTDKPDEGFDPYRFFDPKAIERRIRNGQCLYDPVDLPVSTAYLDAVALLADSVDVVSRWLNAAFVFADALPVEALERLPFVDRVEKTSGNLILAEQPSDNLDMADYLGEDPFSDPLRGDMHIGDVAMVLPVMISSTQAETLGKQIDHMQGRLFADNGYDGTGIRIAVFDGGFPGVDHHPAFEHLRSEDRIIATWDFHRNRADVYRYNAHGTHVLSMIAGKIDGHLMGLATGAEFLLARTEIRREPFFEEKYWLAAAEWADRLGADIINSSLGYIYHRYFPEQMDGQTSLVAQAARIATRKGILVVNAAGNEGNNPRWRVVNTPADVDSVLSVGAVSYPSMLRTEYSSLGPAADGTTKPDLVAIGNVLLAGVRGLTHKQGTSFAAPLVAGFAACLWQKFPTMNNMQLMAAMHQSGSLHPYFDYSHGFGVPQARFFFESPAGRTTPTFDLVSREDRLVVNLRINPLNSTDPPERHRYLYYHIQDQQGMIEQFFVVRMDKAEILTLDTRQLSEGQKIMIQFEGYTATWTF
jgi:serine protease AprX